MVDEHHEPPTGADDPGHLVEGAVEVVEVLEHQARHHGVAPARSDRELRAAARTYTGPPPHAAPADLGVGGVDAHDPPGAAGHRQAGDLPLTAAEVEDLGGAGQVAGRHGQDLLVVLDVGTAGEPGLPPGGVLLPHAGQVERLAGPLIGVPSARQ